MFETGTLVHFKDDPNTYAVMGVSFFSVQLVPVEHTGRKMDYQMTGERFWMRKRLIHSQARRIEFHSVCTITT